MKIQNISLVVLIIAGFILTSCNGGRGGGSLKTDDDKALYSMGAMFGSRLTGLRLTEGEMDTLIQGLVDAASGKQSKVKVEDYQLKARNLFTERWKVNADITKKEGGEFIEKFVKNEQATKTESGLAYKIIEAGSEAKPSSTDVVEVHYKGTLTDGTVFDSSYERNEKITFPLNRVIRGWTEGLQLIGEGGKIKLVIPSDLAYGDQGAPPKIPGGATLVFEIELFKIVKDTDKKTDSKKAKKAKK